MENSNKPQMLSFCALPFIRLADDQEYKIGEYRLWSNTPANWMRYTNYNLTKFMEQYRSRSGIPVGSHGSIISHLDPTTHVSAEEFRGIVVCLSTAAWLKDLGSAADPWIFETWELDPSLDEDERVYKRETKYRLQFNTSTYDRLHPTSYMDVPLVFSLSGPPGSNNQLILQYLTEQITKVRRDSLIEVMYRFHRIRFETPYYTSRGDDLDAMWSGFELMYLPRKDDSKDGGKDDSKSDIPLIVFLWCSLRDELLRRRADSNSIKNNNATQAKKKPSKPGKPERLTQKILEEFDEEIKSGLIDQKYFEPGVLNWAKKLYSKRNKQSHGNPLPVYDEIVEQCNLGILAVGNIIAKEIFAFRIFRREVYKDPMAKGLFHCRNHQINLLFSEYPIIDEVISSINCVKRTDDWLSLKDDDMVGKFRLSEFVNLLWKFSRVEDNVYNFGRYTKYERDAEILKAVEKLIRVLSKFSNSSDSKTIRLASGLCLSEVYSKISAIDAKQKLKNPQPNKEEKIIFLGELASELSRFCDENYFYREDKYEIIDIAHHKGMMIISEIGVWTWIATLLRLDRLYSGSER